MRSRIRHVELSGGEILYVPQMPSVSSVVVLLSLIWSEIPTFSHDCWLELQFPDLGNNGTCKTYLGTYTKQELKKIVLKLNQAKLPSTANNIS